MNNQYLTVGEFAYLARTTKRTVHWYDKKDILKPAVISKTNGYRYYKSEQIIDFQTILLLRQLNFSITEIKSFLLKHNNIRALLLQKRTAITDEIKHLQSSLNAIVSYYKHINETGTLVQPEVKTVKKFKIYYLDKIGPYSDIGVYLGQLMRITKKLGMTGHYLTIFEDKEYSPKKAKMKIAIMNRSNVSKKIEPLKQAVIPSFKALSVKHTSSSKLLSMIWQELAKYSKINGYKSNTLLNFHDMEVYRFVGEAKAPENEGYEVELLMPIL